MRTGKHIGWELFRANTVLDSPTWVYRLGKLALTTAIAVGEYYYNRHYVYCRYEDKFKDKINYIHARYLDEYVVAKSNMVYSQPDLNFPTEEEARKLLEQKLLR